MREIIDDYKNRTLVLVIIGVLMLLLGLAAAIIGPYEMYAFYLFSEGGRFHYDGFGFGSFMFANITWQIIGYYAIAFLCIPLGYGHIRLRKWVRPIMQSFLWCSLIVGVPLMVVFLFMLSVKALSPVVSILVVLSLVVLYLMVPYLLIRFYRSHNVQRTFDAKDQNSYRINKVPIPILVLSALFTFYVVVLHVPIFFNGIFPLFGMWLSGLQGVVALDLSIVSLAFLTWGIFRQKTWAWLGSVVYFFFLTTSVIITLIMSSFPEMLGLMKFPVTEIKLLEKMPLHGIHFVPFIGIPLVITLIVIVLSKRHFKQDKTL